MTTTEFDIQLRIRVTLEVDVEPTTASQDVRPHLVDEEEPAEEPAAASPRRAVSKARRASKGAPL